MCTCIYIYIVQILRYLILKVVNQNIYTFVKYSLKWLEKKKANTTDLIC